jgi:hypothetical protein
LHNINPYQRGIAMSQKLCEKHLIMFEYTPPTGGLKSRIISAFAAINKNPNASCGCPQCVHGALVWLKIVGFVLAFFAFFFYKLPKIIYDKFGKKGVIIYFSCWAAVVLTFIAVNAYNDHQAKVAYQEKRAKIEAAEKAAESERQRAELKEKMIASQERMKATKAKSAEEKRVSEKFWKIEESWSATSDNEYNLNEAVKYCSGQGWRLPTNKDWEELKKVLSNERELSGKFSIKGGGWWWSATKLDNPSGYAYAWTLSNSGFYSDSRPDYEKFYVRCIKQ